MQLIESVMSSIQNCALWSQDVNQEIKRRREKRLTTLIKKIFAKELEKQQSLLKLVSGNFEITMKEIKNIQSEEMNWKKASNLQWRRFLKKKFRIYSGKLVA